MSSSLIEGLAKIKANKEAQAEKERQRQEAANRVKADWWKWPENTTVATVTFLKEFDESSPGYNESQNGLAVIAVEHQAPGGKGYLRRALCSLDSEGKCYPDERHELRIPEDEGGWRQRQNLYIDVLADFGNGEKKHLLIQRNANSSFATALIDEAIDEGSITDNAFKITKVGESTGTQWLLKRLKDAPFDTSEVKPYNLKEVAIREVPYEKQATYYGAVYGDTNSSDSESKPATVDEEW